jgi:hypothetical protein
MFEVYLPARMLVTIFASSSQWVSIVCSYPEGLYKARSAAGSRPLQLEGMLTSQIYQYLDDHSRTLSIRVRAYTAHSCTLPA